MNMEKSEWFSVSTPNTTEIEMSNPSVMANYPDGINLKDAPWNQPDADINDDAPKVFTVQVTLIIRASNEDEMETAMAGMIQGGVVDYDDTRVLGWEYR